MTRDEILEGVRRLEPWFHCLDLGEGLLTKTASIAGEPANHPWPTWEAIQRHLPADLSGCSVLDVGCNAGFYAVEVKRRGAARVVGVDVQRLHIRQAMFVKRALGLDIEFQRASVYDLTPRACGHFDVTLALGLIYHCKHLMLALENLAQVTRRTLLLETAVYPPHKQPAPFNYVHGGQSRRIHSLGYVENPPGAQESAFNWFLPSVDSLDALLRQAGFAEVDVVTVEHERAICVCRKTTASPDSSVLGKLRASLTLAHGDSRVVAGGDVRFTLDVENTGFVTWLAVGEAGTDKGAVRLGAHLYGEDETEISWDYGRAQLQSDVPPGSVVRLDIVLRAPKRPGSYRVEFDMVDEDLAWFEDLGSTVLTANLTVDAR